MQNNGPKPAKRAQKAIVLHISVVQVGLANQNHPTSLSWRTPPPCLLGGASSKRKPLGIHGIDILLGCTAYRNSLQVRKAHQSAGLACIWSLSSLFLETPAALMHQSAITLHSRARPKHNNLPWHCKAVKVVQFVASESGGSCINSLQARQVY